MVENIGVYKGCSFQELAVIFIACFLPLILFLLFILDGLIAIAIALIITCFLTLLSAKQLQSKKRNKPNNYYAKFFTKKLIFNSKYYSPYCK